MATLTSTGAVNLTTSTNWSPAQIPQAGDDLIIGAHTLTLDADMTLGSVTFNNASSRLAISGTTRVVNSTNGWILGTNINISVGIFSAAIPSGTSVTLRGTWSQATAVNGTLPAIASSTGGNLTLATIGDDPSAVLFANTTSAANRIITASWTSGTLTTIGRFDMPTWAGSSTFVTMSGGTWNHTHTGTSYFGTGGHRILSQSGTATGTWTGDFESATSIAASGLFAFAGSGNWTISANGLLTGSSVSAGSFTAIVSFANATNTTTIVGKLCCRNKAVSLQGQLGGGGRINWRNQSLSISSLDSIVAVMNGQGTLDITDLVVSNAGKFIILVSAGSTTVVTGAATLITNTTTAAQAAVYTAAGELDGKVINLSSGILRIPTADEVAADADPFGYSASPITPTGLVVDPAVIAAAVVTSFSSLPEVMVRTTIATLASQTEFTLTAGSSDNDVYNSSNGTVAIITDQSTSVQKAVVAISDYVGSTRTVTLSSAPGFTIATGDLVTVIAGASGGGGSSFPSEAPANWLKAAGIENGAFTAAKFAASSLDGKGDWATPADVLSQVEQWADDAGLFDVLADKPSIAQFEARTLVSSGYAPASTALSTAVWTTSRAGYLDKLNVTGVVASQADINALNQSASRRVILQTVGQWEMPESGTTLYTIELRTFDGDGAIVNADTNPTITVTGQTTGSLAANVGGISNPSTGVYRWLYSVASNATIEPVRIDTSATIGGSAFPMSVYSQVTDFVGVDFTVTDRNNITAIFNKLPSRGFLTGTSTATGALLPSDVGLAAANLDTQLSTINTSASGARTAAESVDSKLTTPRLARIDGAAQSGADNDTLKTLSDQIDNAATSTALTAVSNKLGTPVGVSVSADIAAVKVDTGTTLPGLLTALVTKIRKFFQLSLRKDSAIATDNSVELAEINATGGSGVGTFANTTDAQEALRDRGDSGAWGSASQSPDILISTTIATLASQTVFTLTAGSTDNDAYLNQTAIITDSATATQKAVAKVTSYVGSTKTVTLKALPAFTIAVGDSVAIIAGSSGAEAQAVTLQLGATIPMNLGQVTGLDEDLVVGNSYTADVGRRIPVTLTDASGDPVDTTFGSKSLADPDCSIVCVLHPENSRNTDNVTAAAQGTCEFVPASGDDPASLWVSLPVTETDRLSPGVYRVQFHASWPSGQLVTLAWKGSAKFVRKIKPKT